MGSQRMKRLCALLCVPALVFMMGQSGCPLPTLGGSTRPLTITVVSLPDGSLTGSFSIDLSLFPDAASVNWDFGDGSIVTNLSPNNGRFVTHTFPRSGSYTLRAYAFNRAAAIGSAQKSVNVRGPNQLPVARFTTSDITQNGSEIVPRAVRFNATTSTDNDGTIVSFSWNFGDGTPAATGVTVDHTFASSGRFNVRLTITDDRGGTAETTQSVAGNVRPTAEFSFTPSGAEVPELLTVDFDAGASADTDGTIQTYSWNFGDSSAAGSGATPQHVYNAPGTYNVTLTITDNLGGTASKTNSVAIIGTRPYVASVTPINGQVDTRVENVTITGLNFNVAAAVTLRRSISNTTITGESVNVSGSTSATCAFDLNGAPVGDYDVFVRNPDGFESSLPAGFRVVTPDRVRLRTSEGDIVLELDPVRAPGHVQNFLRYVDEQRYDGIVFHRVARNFVIQGGAFEPAEANATDGARLVELAALPTISSEANNGLSNVRGTIALALRGQDANSGSSQFFINLRDNTSLDTGPPPFTVFGRVIEGLDVVDRIGTVATGSAPVRTLQNGVQSFNEVPTVNVVILSARRE